MKITDWKYELKDISDYPVGVKVKGESILANAVNAANYDLLMKLDETSKVLEIGCGADSFLFKNIPNQSNWDAIDVYEYDSRGRKCIATKLGSVHDIPFEDESFDFILANQSIEHWHEYGVSLQNGIDEIIRALSVGGAAHINFPLFLHGHPWFVKGDLNKITGLFHQDQCNIQSITAFQDSDESNYPGWRRCNFPDFYVNRIHNPESSFVVEIVIERIKISNNIKKNIKNINFQPIQRLSSFRRNLFHGVDVIAWKIVNKLKDLIS